MKEKKKNTLLSKELMQVDFMLFPMVFFSNIPLLSIFEIIRMCAIIVYIVIFDSLS